MSRFRFRWREKEWVPKDPGAPRRRTPLETAREKGRQAFLEGADLTDCPYPDHRKADGRVTFSRAFRNAWRDGWREAQKEKEPDE